MAITTAFRLSVWLRPFTRDRVNYPLIVSKGAINTSFQIQIDNDDAPVKKVLGRIKIGGVAFSVKDPNAVPRDVYTLYELSYDNTNLKLYKNTVEVASTACTGSVDANSGPLVFGESLDGTNGYFGLMFDARLWSIANPSAPTNAPLTGSEANLIGNWMFDEGIGVTVNDKSPNNLDLTLDNSSQWSVLRGTPY